MPLPPTLDRNAADTALIEVGPYARKPFRTSSIYNISGMSYGAISKPAVLALSKGARMAGIWLNTGEGGLSPFHLEGGADIVFQIGTAKYGCRDVPMVACRMRNLRHFCRTRTNPHVRNQAEPGRKARQGRHPARLESDTGNRRHSRHSRRSRSDLAPTVTPEIDSIGDLLDFVSHIREVTGKPTGFKLVLGAYDWLAADDLCTEINRRGIENAPGLLPARSAADGGTGAAPMPLIDYVGLPIWESSPVLCDTLGSGTS